MNKRLPLDEFEREVQKHAEGFEIQPRSIVFDRVRFELAEGTEGSAKTGGRILRTVFSKSMTFISYAAAASVVSVSSVFFVSQQHNKEEQTLAEYQHKSSSFHKKISSPVSPIDTTTTLQLTPEQIAEAANQKATEENNPVSTTNTSIPTQVDAGATNQVDPGTPQISQPKVLAYAPEKENKTIVSGKKRAPSGKTTKQKQGNINKRNKAKVRQPKPVKLRVPVEVVEKQIASADPAEETKPNPGTVPETPETPVTPVANDSQLVVAGIAAPDAKDSAALDTTGYRRIGKKGTWSIAAFYSYDKINATFEDVGAAKLLTQTEGTYQKFRDKTNQASFGYQAGFKVDYSFIEHLVLSSGLNYTQRTNWLSVSNYYSSVYVDSLSAFVHRYFPTGGYGSSFTNTFHYVEIPLTASYTNTINKRIAYRVSAGISYGLMFGQQAYFVDNKSYGTVVEFAPEYVSQKQIRSTPFSQQVVNLNLGAYFSYLVQPQIEVYVGPNIKRSLTSLYKGDYNMVQRFHSFGTEIGVRYYF